MVLIIIMLSFLLPMPLMAEMKNWRELSPNQQLYYDALYRCLRQQIQTSSKDALIMARTSLIIEQLKSTSDVSRLLLQCLQLQDNIKQMPDSEKNNIINNAYNFSLATNTFIKAVLKPKYHCRGVEMQGSFAFVIGGSGQLALYHCLRDDGKKFKILMPSISIATGYGVMAVAGKQQLVFAKDSPWKGKLPASYSLGLGPVIKFGPHFSFYGLGVGAGAIVIDPINRLQIPVTILNAGNDFQKLHNILVFYP